MQERTGARALDDNDLRLLAVLRRLLALAAGIFFAIIHNFLNFFTFKIFLLYYAKESELMLRDWLFCAYLLIFYIKKYYK